MYQYEYTMKNHECTGIPVGCHERHGGAQLELADCDWLGEAAVLLAVLATGGHAGASPGPDRAAVAGRALFGGGGSIPSNVPSTPVRRTFYRNHRTDLYR